MLEFGMGIIVGAFLEQYIGIVDRIKTLLKTLQTEKKDDGSTGGV